MNKNIENIGTRLDKTIFQIIAKSTNQKRTQTLNRRHLILWIHRHQTQEQGKRSARRRKSVVSIRNMTCQTHLRAMVMIRLMTVIIDVNDAKIRIIGKRIR